MRLYRHVTLSSGTILYWALLCITAMSSIIKNSEEEVKDLKEINEVAETSRANLQELQIAHHDKRKALNFDYNSELSLTKSLCSNNNRLKLGHVISSEERRDYKRLNESFRKILEHYIKFVEKKDKKSIDIEIIKDLRTPLKLLETYNLSAKMIHCNPTIYGLKKDSSTYIIEETFGKIIASSFQKFFCTWQEVLWLESSEPSPITMIFDILNFISNWKVKKNKILHKIFSDKKTIQGLARYIYLPLHQSWGHVGIFQTVDIKQFLLNHPELTHVHTLLTTLEDTHWKNIELGFLSCHLSSWSNTNIKGSLMNGTERELFKNTLSEVSNTDKLNPQWLEIFNFEPRETLASSNDFLEEKVFVYHVMRIFQRYFKDFELNELILGQMKVIESIMRSIQTVFKYSDPLNYDEEQQNVSLEPFSRLLHKFNDLTSRRYTKTSSLHPIIEKYHSGHVYNYHSNLSLLQRDNFKHEIYEKALEISSKFETFNTLWDLGEYGHNLSLKIWNRIDQIEELKKEIMETLPFFDTLVVRIEIELLHEAMEP